MGRDFRKRLREHCALADRYGDHFACIVVRLEDQVSRSAYDSVLDGVTEGLRRTDLIFLYRRRLALILPRMSAASLDPLVERLQGLVAAAAGHEVAPCLSALVYPDGEHADTQRVLDWAEDQLRSFSMP